MKLFLSCLCLSALMLFQIFPDQARAGGRAGQDWIQIYDNPDTQASDELYGMAVDGSGNVYITGATNMGDDSNQLYYYLTAKYDSQGERQWVTTYHRGDEYCNHIARDVVYDHEGHVYVTGVSTDWSEGHGLTQADIVTIKYTPGGLDVWTAIYDNDNTDQDNYDDWGYSLAVDSDQNVYVAGITELDETTDHTVGLVTIKYTQHGIQAWASRYEETVVGNWANNSFLPKIALDQAGNVYVAGTKSDLSGDPHVSDLILLKYDNNGVFQWATVYSSADDYSEELFDLAVDEAGNSYLTGSAANPNVSTDEDYITVKINTNGAVLWADRFDFNGSRDMAKSIALDSRGNVLVTGRAYMNGVQTVTIKYDQDGNRLWLAKYAGAEKAGGLDLALDGDDNIYIAGEKYLNYYRCTLLKYNKNGKLIWSVNYDDNNNFGAQKIGLDDDRNIYVAGINWYQATGNDIFTMKYSQTGSDSSQAPRIFLLLSEE